MSRKVKDELQELMEQAVKDVLQNADATAAEKLDAIEKGTKLLAIRLKFKPEGGSGAFPYEKS